MFFKKNKRLFSENIEIKKNCTTCEYSTELNTTNEYMCRLKGIVNSEFLCRKYSYNRFAARIKTKRKIDVSKYSEDDFKL